MSEYTSTTIARVKTKFKKREKDYEELNKIFELDYNSEIQIGECVYDKDDDSIYLYKELCMIPSNCKQLERLKKEFEEYKDLINMDTFSIENIFWYNGADMPLKTDFKN